MGKKVVERRREIRPSHFNQINETMHFSDLPGSRVPRGIPVPLQDPVLSTTSLGSTPLVVSLSSFPSLLSNTS